MPQITDRASLENAFKLLPMSMLALRVEKVDPNAGPQAKKGKRVKGLWTVKIVGQQDAGDDMYYAWLYEGSQVMRKVYAVLALIAIFVIVCYPLWPLKMRLGVYYLSWGFLWLLAGFFAMAIFRVILFCITYFILSPGLWLFPNLWEDVSFVDSFKPVWAWHEVSAPLISGICGSEHGMCTNPRFRMPRKRRSRSHPRAEAVVRAHSRHSLRQPVNHCPPVPLPLPRTHKLQQAERRDKEHTRRLAWRNLEMTSRKSSEWWMTWGYSPQEQPATPRLIAASFGRHN